MRKLALFTPGFSAAIFLCQYFLGFRGMAVLAAVAAADALLTLAVRKKAAGAVRVAALGVAIGTLWNMAYYVVFVSPAEGLNGYEGEINAVVCDYPQDTQYGKKVELRIEQPGRPSPRAILYMYWVNTVELKPGDVIRLDAELTLASEKTENDYFASKGIRLFAYAKTSPVVSGQARWAGLRFFPKVAAKAVKDKIAGIFPNFSVPFMTAILTGDRSLLNEETYMFSTLAATGTAHIVAVSGMHVAFLVGLLQMLLGRNKRGNLMCMPLILLFMAVTGFAPSVVRAGVMQIMVLGGAAFRREYDDLTSLSFALLILLAVNPASVKNGGLQLSFAATLGIMLFGERIYASVSAPFAKGRRLHGLYSHRVSRMAVNFVCSTLASSLGALALTVPISAVMFGYVSIVAPLANLLILWAASLVFSCGMICVIIGTLFAPAGMIAAWIPAGFVWYIGRTASLLSKIPFVSVYTDSMYIRVWLVFMYAELALAAIFRRAKYRLTVFVASNAVVLSLCIGLNVRQARAGSMNTAVLNVGQGQCIVIESQGSTAVIDCGGSLSQNAGDIAADYLAGMGETKVDALILTHTHSDHANGAVELMRRIEVDELIVPQPEDGDEYGEYVVSCAEKFGVSVSYIGDDTDEYTLGSAVCTIIPPLGGKNKNEMGLSVLCTSGSFDALITGDMNYDTEYRLLEYIDLPDIELLIAGHHGSKYSTSERLLEETTPEVVIISVGERNTYGHPAEETLERIADAGASIYRTDTNGTVTVKLGKQEN